MNEVYIQGMKMPTSCSVCWALDDYGDYPRCRITEEQRGYNFPIRQKRMDNCPLVLISKHGDLIERKAICLTDFEIAICNGDYKDGMKMLLEKIKSAPTIIPASEEGE